MLGWDSKEITRQASRYGNEVEGMGLEEGRGKKEVTCNSNSKRGTGKRGIIIGGRKAHWTDERFHKIVV